MQPIPTLPQRIALAGLRLYQKTLSPDHSPFLRRFFPHGYCRFTPSCSQYGVEALQKYGLLKGLPKTLHRLLRCNPWDRGGWDAP